VNWSMLLVALACLVPVVAGAALLLSGDQGGKALGWGLVGFFGAGFVVLGRKAISG
jgi:hypothetical protein